jgi:hypothetical protein
MQDLRYFDRIEHKQICYFNEPGTTVMLEVEQKLDPLNLLAS